MTHVVLIGDSIRLSYQDRVRMLLRAKARLWWPGENGMHSVNVLLQFWEWVEQQQPDVLHVNTGSWDVRHIVRGGAGGNIVPIEQYEENVDRLLTMTRERTRARVIWATTTPIIEERLERFHGVTGRPCRTASDIPEYNARAVAIAKKHGAIVNDLYALVMDSGIENTICDDGVHLTPAGVELLGDAVAQAVTREL